MEKEHSSAQNLAARSLEQLRLSAEQLADRAMRIYRTRAVLWLLTQLLLVACAVVFFDYLLHAEELGLRWLLTLVWLGAWGYLIYRFSKHALPRSIDPVACAHWIELREPQWHGQLSALVALAQLPSSDERYGSKSFREAAMAEHLPLVSQTDWQSYIDLRPTVRAGVALMSLSFTLLAICALWPSIAGRGFVRVMAPWVYAPWPRADELQLVDLPELIALGRELEVQVIDGRPPLPGNVQLEWRAVGGGAQSNEVRSIPMRLLGDLAIVTLPEMQSDFQLRAVGGDDTNAPWREVRVAELPGLTEQRFLVVPPEYTGQPSSELIGQRIEVLADSKVTFQGKFSGAMRSVIAQGTSADSRSNAGLGNSASSNGISSNALASNRTTAEQSPDTAASNPNRQDMNWKAVLSSDGTAFELFTNNADEALIQRERRWQLRFETMDGLEALDPTIWSIRVNPDRPPQVNLATVQPTIITRQASVQVTGSASDDLGLSRVDLVWRSDASEQSERQTLWQSNRDNAKTKADDSNGSGSSKNAQDLPKKATTVSTIWRPDSQRLTMGQVVTLVLEAIDSKGQVSQSVPQTLELQADDAVLAESQSNKSVILEPLRDLLENQLRNIQAVTRAKDILNASDTPEESQLDPLANARQLEQAIAQQVSRSPASVLSKLQELSRKLRLNALDESQLARELRETENAITTMSEEGIEPALKQVDESFNSLREAVREGSEKKLQAARDQLQSSLESQQQTAASLKQLLGSLSSAESMLDVQKRLQRVLADQKSVREETERLQVQSVTGTNRSTELDAKRIGLRSDQQNLARSIEEVAAMIDTHITKQLPSETEDKLSDTESARNRSPDARTGDSTAQTWTRLQRGLSDQRFGSRMRDAAERVDSKQFSEALQVQRDIVQSLESLTAGLSGSADSGLANTQADLQHTANEIAELANRQQSLSEQMASLSETITPGAPTNPTQTDVANKQQQLAREIQQAQEQWTQRASDSIRQTLQAATELAETSAGQSQASSWKDASQSASGAAEKLRQSQDSIRSRAEALDKQLATQKLLDLKTRIAQLLEQQSPLVLSLQKLAASEAAGEAVQANFDKSLREAAATQERIRKQLMSVPPETDAAGSMDAFAWVMETCQQEMARSVAALERGRLVPDGLDASTSALDRLTAASEALDATTGRSENPKDTNADKQTATAKDQSADRSEKDESRSLPSLASLRLLRSMQNKINQRTGELLSGSSEPVDARLERLADQQSDLARQTEKLLKQLSGSR